MAEPDATQVLAGPGKMYIAPLGSTLPTFDGHGEYPVVWPVAWKAVGYTDAGIDATYTPTVKEIMVDEETAPVSDILTAEKFSLAAHLAEATLQNLNRAISASTYVDDSVANQDIHVTGGSQALNYVMVGVEGPAPGTNLKRVIILRKAIAKAAVAFKIQRKDKVVFPVEFDARQISGQALFEIHDFTLGAS
jgi:hypothetical protein